jgi:3-dehydroquinate dehydratase-1
MTPLVIRGKTLNRVGDPLICTSLVGRNKKAIDDELASIVPKRPDVLEWRVDFFDKIHEPDQVENAALAIRRAAGDLPIIFTRRAAHEGGEVTGIDEESVVALYERLIVAGAIDIIDTELSQPAANRSRLRAASRAHGVAMILSHHNFDTTPSLDAILEKFVAAEREGADIAKVAVMPHTPADVFTLLEATMAASERLTIPLISISMGGLGALSRICGALVGSAMTYAVGESRSAPGQIPIDALRAALTTLARARLGN